MRVFFEEELRGLKDAVINGLISKMSREEFQSRKPLYSINESSRAIFIHPEWKDYFERNYTIVKSWIAWEWLDYMQRRNPNTPALSKKLFPPLFREPLTQQTKYWKAIMKHEQICCIYSKKILSSSLFSIDHYLPWSFVAHDQLWNLVPIDPSVNSSKSNKIPSMKYIDDFVRIQYTALITSKQLLTNTKWLKSVEPFIADLRMESDDDLMQFDKLLAAYRRVLAPLSTLASSQGFSSNWIYRLE